MNSPLNQLDTVEIKVTIDPEQVKDAEDLLKLKPDEGEKRKIYFCEDAQMFSSTKQLRLLDQGVILRLRQNEDDLDDSTVKLRPAPAQISSEWRELEGLKVEGDWVGDRKVEAASFTVKQNKGEIEAVIAGERSLEKLFSKQQEQFLKMSAPIEIDLEELQVLGPVKALRWKSKTYLGLGYPIRSECWILPNGSQLLELSIRVLPDQAQAAQKEFIHYLESNSLDPNGMQETKTRVVLEFFAKELQEKRPERLAMHN